VHGGSKQVKSMEGKREPGTTARRRNSNRQVEVIRQMNVSWIIERRCAQDTYWQGHGMQ
jgi:hypothetical protein